MSEPVIVVDHVSMKFNISKQKVDSLQEYISKLMKRELQYKEFWALKDVSFTVSEGDRVGILGLNGAGKSTLLKIIAGVFKPTEGTVTRRGKTIPLWNWERDLSLSIPVGRIFSSTVPCWDTLKAF